MPARLAVASVTPDEDDHLSSVSRLEAAVLWTLALLAGVLLAVC